MGKIEQIAKPYSYAPTMLLEDFCYLGSVEVTYLHNPEKSSPWGAEPESVEILRVCLVLGEKRADIMDVMRKDSLEKIEEEILENL